MMNMESSVSLFAAVWPHNGTSEAEALHKKIGVPKKGNPAHFKQNYQKILTVAQVVIVVCQSAADALLNARYGHFDAHVKNFGCHITAYDVRGKLLHVRDEAHRIQELCGQRLAEIAKMFAKPPVGENNMSFEAYCKHVKIDIEVSPAFGELVSYHFLHLIHDKVARGSEEVPITCLDSLERIKNTLEHGVRGNIISFEKWVDGLQAKVSHHQVKVVQKLAHALFDGHERTHIVRKFVSSEHMRTAQRSPVVMLPQSYTTETVMHSLEGVLVVKNKLTLASKPRYGAERDVLFVHMPEGKILSEHAIVALKDDEPVVVLDGFRGECRLEDLVKQYGVHTILHASVAKLPEYTTDFDQKPLEHDPHLNTLARMELPFRADHMYLSSVKEERHG